VSAASWIADAPMAPLVTYRVGGRAAWLVTATGIEDLLEVARRRAGREVLVVGRGSNLLVADAGFDGIVVQLGESFASLERSGDAVEDASGGADVVAGGAALLPVVARRTVVWGLTGFEWAVGVPGSIGGAVRMNAGGHGSDMARSLVGVRVVDLASGEDVEVAAPDLDLSYRRSNLRADQVVVRATLRLFPGDPEAGEAQIAEIVRWRRENQPGGQNAGSVFTNPPGDSAGRLIDEAGCRGLRVGSAEVSTKHANFIQADVDGLADDVFSVMVEVARRVRHVHGVDLHPETRLVGFPDFATAVSGSWPEVSS